MSLLCSMKINRRAVWGLFAFVALFNYLYPVAINGLLIDTGEILHIIGIVYFVVCSKGHIPSAFFRLFLYTALLVIVGVGTSLLNTSFDLSLLKKIVSIYLYSFSSIFVVGLIDKSSRCITYSVVLEWLIFSAVIQALVSLFFFFHKELQNALINFMDPAVTRADFMATQASFRLIAFAKTQYANMAIMYGFAFLALISLPFLSNSLLYKHKLWYCFCLVTVLIAGVLSARTFFFILLISLFYLLYFLYKRKGVKIVIGYFLILIVVVLCSLSAGVSLLLDSEYGETFHWAFEWYVNMKENGDTSTGSTQVLQSMYFFPTHVKTWLWGDALFTSCDGGFYKGTDVGYLRNLFYWGILGSLCYYFIQYKYCNLIVEKSKSNTFKRLCAVMLLCVFVYNAKEFWHANLYWALFLAATIKIESKKAIK